MRCGVTELAGSARAGARRATHHDARLLAHVVHKEQPALRVAAEVEGDAQPRPGRTLQLQVGREGRKGERNDRLRLREGRGTKVGKVNGITGWKRN